ncbi:hypothetical protein [Aureivirga sp. CE67]|uniref:hypothetical protein n=1 Tax=Aureivirga sp. CE67 TaxID=1788983 RepID=UPI0018CBBFD8|nr:hypothetical protein [Aureivirga sp. CE67]
MAEKFEGELYIGDLTPPQLTDFDNLDDENAGAFELMEADSAEDANVVYDRVIFKYKDPTSPPHTRKKCGKWSKPLPGVKICVGWTINYRWLYRIGHVRVTTISGTNAKNALEECLKQSAIAALIAGVASGGSAAAAAAEIALKACLASKIGDKLISVSVNIKSTRGSWE